MIHRKFNFLMKRISSTSSKQKSMHSVESNNAIFTLKQEPSKIHISNGMKYDLVTEKKRSNTGIPRPFWAQNNKYCVLGSIGISFVKILVFKNKFLFDSF